MDNGPSSSQAAADPATQRSSSTPPEAERATHFQFTNKMLQLEGAYFRRALDTGEPVYCLDLGELKVTVPVRSLFGELDIARTSSDGRLLGSVERALRYVSEIRHGDPIPREMLDGGCSWPVEERHRTVARQRLTLHLAAWIAGHSLEALDQQQIEMLAEDPQTKKRVASAFEEAAARLGLKGERRKEVFDRFEAVSRELAAVEALHDRYARVRTVADKVGRAASLCAREGGMTDELVRTQLLMRKPMRDFERLFASVDAQAGDITAMLRNLDGQIAGIRSLRDKLNFKLMRWNHIAARWHDVPIELGEALDTAMRETYRFLARHYAPRRDWHLEGRAVAKTAMI